EPAVGAVAQHDGVPEAEARRERRDRPRGGDERLVDALLARLQRRLLEAGAGEMREAQRRPEPDSLQRDVEVPDLRVLLESGDAVVEHDLVADRERRIE